MTNKTNYAFGYTDPRIECGYDAVEVEWPNIPHKSDMPGIFLEAIVYGLSTTMIVSPMALVELVRWMFS